MQLRRCAVLLALLLAWSSSLFPKPIPASSLERVVDASDAAVPNVQISIVQTETNFHFTSVTNSDGIYRVQSLQPGPYTVTFEAQGFKRLVREDITLRVGDVLPVDATMQVGAVTESVEVKAQSTLLETETSATGTVTEGDQLYKLNMYQRYITNTLSIVPGVTNQTTGGTNGLGAFNVNGQRTSGTAVFEDGVFANDPLASNNLVIKPIMNSVDEVKVLTGTLPAEYGHSASGVITTVKKSGTNEFHGAVSDYGRTRIMTHRAVFQLIHHRATAAGQPQRRTGLVHDAGWKRRRSGSHPQDL